MFQDALYVYLGLTGCHCQEIPLRLKRFQHLRNTVIDLIFKKSRIQEQYEVPEAKVKDVAIKTDKQRASYYNYYTSKKWGDLKSYDLCIDSSILGIDGTVELIKQAVALKEKNL